MARTLAGEDMVKDPNCNVYIPKNAAMKSMVKGEAHYFCSAECMEAFKRRV